MDQISKDHHRQIEPYECVSALGNVAGFDQDVLGGDGDEEAEVLIRFLTVQVDVLEILKLASNLIEASRQRYSSSPKTLGTFLSVDRWGQRVRLSSFSKSSTHYPIS